MLREEFSNMEAEYTRKTTKRLEIRRLKEAVVALNKYTAAVLLLTSNVPYGSIWQSSTSGVNARSKSRARGRVMLLYVFEGNRFP